MNKEVYFKAGQELQFDNNNRHNDGRRVTIKGPHGSGVFNVADIISHPKFRIGTPDLAYTCEYPTAGEDEWVVVMEVNNSCSFNIADVIVGFSGLKIGSPGLVPCEECPPIRRR